MYLYYCIILALLCSAALADTARSLSVKKRSTPVETVPVSTEHVRRVDPVVVPSGDKYSRSSVDSVGIYGPNDLSWFVDIEVGGQTFSVILDTGSTLTAIPINTCTRCDSNTPHAYYTPSATSNVVNCASSACTYKTCFPNTNACLFNISYLDTSFISGGYYTDVVTLAGLSASATFGAIYQSYSTRSGFASPQADGIMGLGYNNPALTCAPNCASPVLDSIIAGNSGVVDMFSILLSGDEGVITVGGADPSFYTGSIAYTPITTASHYYISLQGISVGNHALSGFGTSAIIDSGSSFMLFPAAAFNQFKSYLQSEYCSVPLVCGSHNIFGGYCYTSNQYLSSLPSMTFTFNGAAVTISPSNYIVGITTTSNGKTTDIYCLGISSYNENFVILGDTFMTDTYVIFDRVNSRVGFATGVYSASALEQSTSSSSNTTTTVSTSAETSSSSEPTVTATKPSSSPTTTTAISSTAKQTSAPISSQQSSDEFTSSGASVERVASPLVACVFGIALVFVLF